MSTHPQLLAPFVHLITQVISIQIDPAAIGEHTTIADDLMIDSISLVSLVSLSEERFAVDLSGHAESIADLRTVGDALALIASAQASNGDPVQIAA